MANTLTKDQFMSRSLSGKWDNYQLKIHILDKKKKIFTQNWP